MEPSVSASWYYVHEGIVECQSMPPTQHNVDLYKAGKAFLVITARPNQSNSILIGLDGSESPGRVWMPDDFSDKIPARVTMTAGQAVYVLGFSLIPSG